LVFVKVTYTSASGEREASLRLFGKGVLLYPAVDSDEHGHYKIERIGKAKGTGGSSGGIGDSSVMVSAGRSVSAYVANLGLKGFGGRSGLGMKMKKKKKMVLAKSNDEKNGDYQELTGKKPTVVGGGGIAHSSKSNSASVPLLLRCEVVGEVHSCGRRALQLMQTHCCTPAAVAAAAASATSASLSSLSKYGASLGGDGGGGLVMGVSPALEEASFSPLFVFALVQQLQFASLASDVVNASKVLAALLAHRDPAFLVGAGLAFFDSANSNSSSSSTTGVGGGLGDLAEAEALVDILFGLVQHGILGPLGMPFSHQQQQEGSMDASQLYQTRSLPNQLAKRPNAVVSTAAAEAVFLLRTLLASNTSVTLSSLAPSPSSSLQTGFAPPGAAGGVATAGSTSISGGSGDGFDDAHPPPNPPPLLRRSSSSTSYLSSYVSRDWRSLVLPRITVGATYGLQGAVAAVGGGGGVESSEFFHHTSPLAGPGGMGVNSSRAPSTSSDDRKDGLLFWPLGEAVVAMAVLGGDGVGVGGSGFCPGAKVTLVVPLPEDDSNGSGPAKKKKTPSTGGSASGSSGGEVGVGTVGTVLSLHPSAGAAVVAFGGDAAVNAAVLCPLGCLHLNLASSSSTSSAVGVDNGEGDEMVDNDNTNDLDLNSNNSSSSKVGTPATQEQGFRQEIGAFDFLSQGHAEGAAAAGLVGVTAAAVVSAAPTLLHSLVASVQLLQASVTSSIDDDGSNHYHAKNGSASLVRILLRTMVAKAVSSVTASVSKLPPTGPTLPLAAALDACTGSNPGDEDNSDGGVGGVVGLTIANNAPRDPRAVALLTQELSQRIYEGTAAVAVPPVAPPPPAINSNLTCASVSPNSQHELQPADLQIPTAPAWTWQQEWLSFGTDAAVVGALGPCGFGVKGGSLVGDNGTGSGTDSGAGTADIGSSTGADNFGFSGACGLEHLFTANATALGGVKKEKKRKPMPALGFDASLFHKRDGSNILLRASKAADLQNQLSNAIGASGSYSNPSISRIPKALATATVRGSDFYKTHCHQQ
jgi:hypothetical protein